MVQKFYSAAFKTQIPIICRQFYPKLKYQCEGRIQKLKWLHPEGAGTPLFLPGAFMICMCTLESNKQQCSRVQSPLVANMSSHSSPTLSCFPQSIWTPLLDAIQHLHIFCVFFPPISGANTTNHSLLVVLPPAHPDTKVLPTSIPDVYTPVQYLPGIAVKYPVHIHKDGFVTWLFKSKGATVGQQYSHQRSLHLGKNRNSLQTFSGKSSGWLVYQHFITPGVMTWSNLTIYKLEELSFIPPSILKAEVQPCIIKERTRWASALNTEGDMNRILEKEGRSQIPFSIQSLILHLECILAWRGTLHEATSAIQLASESLHLYKPRRQLSPRSRFPFLYSVNLLLLKTLQWH